MFQAVRIFQDLINAGKYEEATYNMWILKSIAEKTEMTSTSRTAVIGF